MDNRFIHGRNYPPMMRNVPLFAAVSFAVAHMSSRTLSLHRVLRIPAYFHEGDGHSATLISRYRQFTKNHHFSSKDGRNSLFSGHHTPVPLSPDKLKLPVLDLPQSVLAILDEFQKVQAARQKTCRARLGALFATVMLSQCGGGHGSCSRVPVVADVDANVGYEVGGVQLRNGVVASGVDGVQA